MIGQLTPSEIENVLHNGIIGHIGCGDGNIVYVVPISYVYEDGSVYCHTHEGQKVNMLRRHPVACFQMEHIHDLANWQSVIAEAKFEELKEPVQRLEALQRLYNRKLPSVTSQTTILTDEWPFPSPKLADIAGVVFRLRLYNKTGRFERSQYTSKTFF